MSTVKSAYWWSWGQNRIGCGEGLGQEGGVLEGVNGGRGGGDICNTFNIKDKLPKKGNKTELAHMTMIEAANVAGKQLYHLQLISTDMAPIHISYEHKCF